MKKSNQAQRVKDLAKAIGWEAETYSGRGMFGRRCWSISCDSAADILERIREFRLPRPTIDSMGLGVVCYWPEIEAEQK